MINAQLTYFDTIVVGIMLLSCLFAFFRGIVKEVLSLGSWLGAGLVTMYYFRPLAEWMKPHFQHQNEMVLGGIAALGLYIVSLVVFSIISMLIMKFIKQGSDVGFLDNFFGLLFGLFRGVFIVSFGYLILSMFINSNDLPDWLEEAHTRPVAEKGAIILARVAPDYLQAHSSLIEKITNGQTAETGNSPRKTRTLITKRLDAMKNEAEDSADKIEEKAESTRERLERTIKSLKQK